MRNKKRLLIAGIICLGIVAAGAVFTVVSINKYMDTHTWATLRITGEVHRETDDAYEEKIEVLKGEKKSLDGGTTVVIKDIKHDGTVTLSFLPAVTGADGREIEEAKIAYKEKLDFKESSGNGISACWTFQVAGHRYQ